MLRPLPNVRKLFLPDKGHLLCDVDLSGADAQVVAWEADDADLKNAFRNGLDIHNHNGKALWGSTYNPDLVKRKYTMRDELKRAVHGTNYAAGPRTLSTTLGWSQAEVRSFQDAWFKLHPGVKAWHARTEFNLNKHRMVTNRFGARIVYFDRPDNLLPKGLAWLPQSTIASVTELAAISFEDRIPWATLLLQVHDSLLFQVPFHRVSPSNFDLIRQAIRVEIPYDDPLTIPWGLKTSLRNWGEVSKTKWEDVSCA